MLWQEVDTCKDECKAVMADAERMNALITKFRNKCSVAGRGEGLLNEGLREAFTELEGYVIYAYRICYSIAQLGLELYLNASSPFRHARSTQSARGIG